jgi:hypothetical protein
MLKNVLHVMRKLLEYNKSSISKLWKLGNLDIKLDKSNVDGEGEMRMKFCILLFLSFLYSSTVGLCRTVISSFPHPRICPTTLSLSSCALFEPERSQLKAKWLVFTKKELVAVVVLINQPNKLLKIWMNASF